MLPTLGAPNKKSTPEQQMAMMRTYINQLKDDTEGELYNIRWENLAKPLQEKLNGFDKDIVAQGEQFDYLTANMISVGYLETNYLTAGEIDATYVKTDFLETEFVYAGAIAASQITSGRISTNHLSTDVVIASDITASSGDFYYLSSGQLDARYVRATVVDADYIVGKFTSATTAWFDRINLGTLPYSNSSSPLRIHAGQGYANVYLKATGTEHQYYLVVNMPD